jgi:hypothetical protein
LDILGAADAPSGRPGLVTQKGQSKGVKPQQGMRGCAVSGSLEKAEGLCTSWVMAHNERVSAQKAR